MSATPARRNRPPHQRVSFVRMVMPRLRALWADLTVTDCGWPGATASTGVGSPGWVWASVSGVTSELERHIL